MHIRMKRSLSAADLLLRASAAALIAGAATTSAHAQASDDETEDVVIVTGSRLNQANLSAPSPVFQVDSGEIDARGVTRVEDLINILPQAFASQTSQVANGASGTSQVNLRGLGAVRTLVLIDGKRVPYGAPQGGSGPNSAAAANLDLIPAQLVERVDVVTGGASAVYGSDAVAGVVNFILKRDFEGLEIDGQFGFYQDGNGRSGDAGLARQALSLSENPIPGGALDGRNVNISALFGANTADGRGNVTAQLSYQDQNEVRQGSRDHGACALGSSSSAQSVDGVGCIGSSAFRRFDPNVSTFPSLFQLENGTFVPRAGGPSQTFNFNPDNFYQRPNERFSIYSTAHYDITDNVEAYLDAGYITNTTDAQIAFSATFGRPFQVNCDNPLLDAPLGGGVSGTLADAYCTPAQVASGEDVDFVTFRRNVEGDPRNQFLEVNTLRLVAGLRGDFANNWNWDVWGQFGRSSLTIVRENDLNFERVQDAFFLVDDGAGNAVCRSGNAGCVPYNIFQRGPAGESLVTDDAIDFIQGVGISTGSTEQILIGGTLGGELGEYGLQSPWAEAGVQALVGVEYREDRLLRTSDDVSQIPGGVGLTGVGGGTLDINGVVKVTELYMETQIPLVTGMPFMEELAINGAYRYSDYSTDGNGVQNSFNTDTFSAGVSWTPVPDIRFRAQFQRAVRAPNVFDLFLGQNTGLFVPTIQPNGFADPCAGDFAFTDFDGDGADDFPAPAASASQCAFTGVTAAQYGTISDNPAQQLNQVTGGNPLLSPESADTYTLGVVIQPRFVDGLNIAVDYYDITLEDAINTIPPAVTLDNCIATGDPQFCDLVIRDRFGSLYIDNSNFEGVQAVNTNIAEEVRRGIDIAVNYSHDIGSAGSLSWNYVGSYLLEDTEVSLPGATPTECEGFYAGACNAALTPVFEYSHRMITTWQSPYNVDLTATWRYLSGVDAFNGGDGTALSNRLEAANYLDLAAQLYVNENTTMRFGINNILGRDPNLTTLAGNGPAGNGNTYPGSYTALGRFIFAGVNLSF